MTDLTVSLSSSLETEKEKDLESRMDTMGVGTDSPTAMERRS
jgi:hypothetical protein